MGLSHWIGFTEFDLSCGSTHHEYGVDNVTSHSLSSLPEKTQSDLILKKHAYDIFLSIEGLGNVFDVLQTGEEIKSCAEDLFKSFCDYPKNARYEDDRLNDKYVSPIDIFMNMNNSRTGIPLGLEDMYVLAFMLIHEAIRLNDEKSKVAAIEAIETYGVARLRFHAFSIKDQASKQRTKSASNARHAKNDIVKFYAQDLARQLKETNSSLKYTEICEQILDQVTIKAKEVGKTYTDNFYNTLYEWIRDAIKNNFPS